MPTAASQTRYCSAHRRVDGRNSAGSQAGAVATAAMRRNKRRWIKWRRNAPKNLRPPACHPDRTPPRGRADERGRQPRACRSSPRSCQRLRSVRQTPCDARTTVRRRLARGTRYGDVLRGRAASRQYPVGDPLAVIIPTADRSRGRRPARVRSADRAAGRQGDRAAGGDGATSGSAPVVETVLRTLELTGLSDVFAWQ